MYFTLKPTKITTEHIKLNPKEYAFVHLKLCLLWFVWCVLGFALLLIQQIHT